MSWFSSVVSTVGSGIADTISGIESVGSQVVNGIVSGIDGVASEVGGEINSVANEVGTIVDGAYQDVANTFSDLGNLAVSTITTLENDIGTAITATFQGITTVYDETITGFDNLVSAQVNAIKNLGSATGTFLKEYGHTIVDIAANYVCPGSSLLVDALWAEAATGKLPSLTNLGVDAAESFADELLPGVNGAISDELPGIIGDVTNNELNNAVNTFISTGSLPTGKDLLNNAAASIVSEGQDLAEEALSPVESALSSVIPDISDAVQFVQNTAGEVNEIIDTAQSIQKMTQGQIIALAGAGITELASANDITVDAQQALALISSGIQIVAPAVELIDTAANILTFSQAQLEALASAGIQTIGSSDAQQLIVSWQEVQELAAAGVSLVSAADPVVLDEPGSALSIFTDSFIQDIAKTGVKEILGTSNVSLNVDQALSLGQYGIQVGAEFGSTLTLSDSGVAFSALTIQEIKGLVKNLYSPMITATSELDLTLGQIQAFANAGITVSSSQAPTLVVDTAANLQNLSASEIASFIQDGVSAIKVSSGQFQVTLPEAVQLSISGIRITDSQGIAIDDTLSAFYSRTSQQIAALTQIGVSLIDLTASVADIEKYTPQSFGALLMSAPHVNVVVSDTIASIEQLSDASLSTFTQDGVSGFEISDTLLNVLSSQSAISSLKEKILGWNITSTASSITSLTVQQIGQLANDGVQTIVDTSSVAASEVPGLSPAGANPVVSFSMGQVQALEAANISVARSAGAPIILSVTAAAFEQLSAAQISELAKTGVSSIKITDTSVTANLSQAEALVASNLTLTTPSGATSSVLLPVGTFPTYPTPTALVPLFKPDPLIHAKFQLSPIQTEGGSLDFQIEGGGSVTQAQLASFAASGLTTVLVAQNQSVFGNTSTSISSANGEIYALYEGLLGRTPDALGAEGWVASLDSGSSIAQIAQAFLNSPEGQQSFPSTSSNKSFVDTLYRKILGRSADAGGEQTWINNLNAGESRANVAESFVFSNEYISDLQPALSAGVFVADANTSEVARLYYGLLDRAPDQGGLSGNTQALDNGTSIQALAQSFLSSAEYRPMAPMDNSIFVTQLYENALGRSPDSVGLQSWDNALASGASRASVAVGIIESSEAQVHLASKIEVGFHLA